MERRDGCYWVKHDGDWFIAEWERCIRDDDNGCIKGLMMWHYTYGSCMIVTDIVDEINETRIPAPDESNHPQLTPLQNRLATAIGRIQPNLSTPKLPAETAVRRFMEQKVISSVWNNKKPSTKDWSIPEEIKKLVSND